MPETRKLAAILAADVAGYSKLAGSDEERTLARLRALRSDLTDPTIAVHHGRVVKRTGDGSIIEFRSVVDAVRCAIEVQNGMVERNAGLPPERRIEFRIGIHLGDVVEESDGDLMGDGVNIAARLEGIAKPGSICLSEQAYWQVKSRLDLAVSDLGTTQLKNIAEPVRVYSVEVGKPASLKPAKVAQRNLLPILAAIVSLIVIVGVGALYFAGGQKLVTPSALQPTTASPPAEIAKQAAPEPPKVKPERLSIVVLPFTNLGGDPTQDYLANVITEELTTSLSRIVDSFVIAGSTALTYKGKAVDAKQIGKELGVRYVLEGSAQPSGNRVRIVAQLISAETGAHLWAEQFDTDRGDILQMQDEIVTSLTSVLEKQLVKVEAAHIARTRPGNPSAEDLALQCYASNPFKLNLCERALQIDPGNALALGGLAWNSLVPILADRQDIDLQEAIRRADEWVTQAIAADPNLYMLHFVKTWVLILEKRPEEAIVAAERSLALNPSFVAAYVPLCIATAVLGRPERAVELADKAIRLSPRDPGLPSLYWQKAYNYFILQHDVQAIEWTRRTLATMEYPTPRLYLAALLALNGNEAEARETFKRYLSLPGGEIRTIRAMTAWLNQWSPDPDTPYWAAYVKRLSEGLRRAGMPEE
jgi:adenylate cyclase